MPPSNAPPAKNASPIGPGTARAIQRTERGQFLPGQTGNPGGRPKGLDKRVRELVDFDAIIEAMRDIALGKLPPGITATTHNTPSIKDRIKAAQLLFDRGHGKARQVIDLAHTLDEGRPIDEVFLDGLDPVALEIFERALAARLEPPPPGVMDVVAREVPAAPPVPAQELERAIVDFPSSSNIKRAELEPASGLLVVTFTSGQRFRYRNVTIEQLEQWHAAPSAGKWFAANLRSNPAHPCEPMHVLHPLDGGAS